MQNDTGTRDDAHAFGIRRIDEQHQELFAIADELALAVLTEKRWMAVHSLLVKLSRAVSCHFSTEEALMEILGFPDFDAHRQTHLAFLEKLEEFKMQALRGEIPAEVGHWIAHWVDRHIRVEDGRYAEFFQRRLAANCSAAA